MGMVTASASTRLVIGFATLFAAVIADQISGDHTLVGVLLGSGIVLASDGLKDMTASRAQVLQDLDETRRLLYMALAIRDGTAERPHDLAGTLANALIHHSNRLDTATAERLAMAIARGAGLTAEQIDQLHALVADVTRQMGEVMPT